MGCCISWTLWKLTPWDGTEVPTEGHLFVAHLPTRALSVIPLKRSMLLPVLLIMSCDYWSKRIPLNTRTHTHVCDGEVGQELQSNFSLFCWVLQIGHLIKLLPSWRCISYSSPCCSNQVHENSNSFKELLSKWSKLFPLWVSQIPQHKSEYLLVDVDPARSSSLSFFKCLITQNITNKHKPTK